MADGSDYVGRLAAKEQQRLGLPDGFEKASPWPFGSMNQEDDRAAIADSEFYWVENYIRIGGGYYRTLWDKGPPLYTAPPALTQISFFWFNVNSTLYCAVFLSDGSAVQVSTSGATVQIGPAGTFWETGAGAPACTLQSGQYLLIANNFGANNYWVWDGKILYEAGTAGPIVDLIAGGSKYISPPLLTAFGGQGSGLTATATVTNGSVTAVTITNPGQNYGPSDIVQFAFSGGGSDSSPILVATLASSGVVSVLLTNAGQDYTSAPTVTFTAASGSGAAATAVISGGSVFSVTMTSTGAGYTAPPTVTFTDGGGTGATGVAQLAGAAVASIAVTSGGTGFKSAPTLTITGGGGSGATATASLSNGAISSVSVTSGGSNYTGIPAVVVSPGFNKSAYAEAEMMPFGISGAAMESFENRVWLFDLYSPPPIVNALAYEVSAPSSFTDFGTGDGGLLTTNNQPINSTRFIAAKQSNGYLYPILDSSADVISNVQTGGSPTSTTLNYQNVDPQNGAAWRDTVQYFGLSVLMANRTGIYGLYGGALKKISKKITRLIDGAVFPENGGATPSGAVASIHTIRCYLCLMTITDPFTKEPRTVMLGWDESGWFVVSQSLALTYIGSQVQNSEYTAWGTDGRSLYPLLATPSPLTTKMLSTKLYGAQSAPTIKLADMLFVQTQDKSSNAAGVVMTATVDSELGALFSVYNPLNFAGQPNFPTAVDDLYGTTIGVTLASQSLDYVVRHLAIGYINAWGGRGDMPAGAGKPTALG